MQDEIDSIMHTNLPEYLKEEEMAAIRRKYSTDAPEQKRNRRVTPDEYFADYLQGS